MRDADVTHLKTEDSLGTCKMLLLLLPISLSLTLSLSLSLSLSLFPFLYEINEKKSEILVQGGKIREWVLSVCS